MHGEDFDLPPNVNSIISLFYIGREAYLRNTSLGGNNIKLSANINYYILMKTMRIIDSESAKMLNFLRYCFLPILIYLRALLLLSKR